MTPDRLKQIISDHLDVPSSSVVPSARFDELGADSLDRVELAILIEEEAGFLIPDAAADRIDTVGQLLRYVKERLA